MIKLTIPIEPKAQTRPKFGRGGAYEDPKMKAWRRSATYLIKSLYKGEKLQGYLKTEVTFYLKAPQVVSKKPTPKAKAKTWERYERFMNERIYCAKKPDLDNLEKAIYDSISDANCIWWDDNQVVEHTTKKVYSPNPRIEIKIKKI
jgi:Holliday junction resolvase RusA-like endonuclease